MQRNSEFKINIFLVCVEKLLQFRTFMRHYNGFYPIADYKSYSCYSYCNTTVTLNYKSTVFCLSRESGKVKTNVYCIKRNEKTTSMSPTQQGAFDVCTKQKKKKKL